MSILGKPSIRVGCAGWSIPKQHARLFPIPGTHLSRYAAVFPAVEIDSSFYRLHREDTYCRWADSVPASFRFSVKISREITHKQRLKAIPLLDEFLQGPLALGEKLGPLLVQLPASFAFDSDSAAVFFRALRARFHGSVVCEPRHPSWFSHQAHTLLEKLEVGRAAVDPAPVLAAGAPGGSNRIAYFRLHGSPEMYRSSYSQAFLAELVSRLRRVPEATCVWCIFDNTALGAAIPNAIRLLEMLGIQELPAR